MRLFDHIAQCSAPLIVRQYCGDLWRLTGPSDYASEVTRCPLRYVLTDELLRACIELAYSEGAGLAGCLDLIHLPAERLWIEWNGATQREQIARMLPGNPTIGDVDGVHHGVLVSAHPGGRSGTWRTFWLPPAEPREPMLAAIETIIDLDGDALHGPAETLFDGSAVGVRDPRNRQVNELLRCASFQLDPVWQRYYTGVACTAAERAHVITGSVGAVAFDVPVLLALFLLLALPSALERVPTRSERLNAKRRRLGKPPLLAEVSCPVLCAAGGAHHGDELTTPRTAPRLHHVRGHIVRRRDVVFWRRSHWRGHLRLGCVRSRTATLRLPGTFVGPQGNPRNARSAGSQ